jgi:hypothetical protein
MQKIYERRERRMEEKKKELYTWPIVMNKNDLIAIREKKSLRDEAIDDLLSGYKVERYEEKHTIRSPDGKDVLYLWEILYMWVI